jgi:heme o synthase
LDTNKTYTQVLPRHKFLALKLKDYVMLVKFRLSLVVVISSVLGYVIASGGNGSWSDISLLIAGGFLVTGAANALNQVLEKDFDILMTRTSNRPVATGRMKSSEGVMFAGISCLIGISLLALFNPVTALLGMLSMIIYAFVYTPLKRYSTLAVAVGAIPGALPVMIGMTAFEGTISLLAICLFAIQFLWQFPHFWSIGFLGYEDYKKAGYKLLPESNGTIDRSLGLSAIFYGMFIIPVVVLMYFNVDISLLSTSFVLMLTLGYIFLSYIFHKKFDRSSALKLMFYSFFYLPFVLMTYWLM